ncbi:MAG: NUDIX domain-containing protein [Polyangiaceae bacterium]
MALKAQVPAVQKTPKVTVECVVFSVRNDKLAVLLTKRAAPPFEGSWSLPTGVVSYNEALERAAVRVLEQQTGLSSVRFEQLGAVGTPGRDPRGHTISIVYYTFMWAERMRLVPGPEASEVKFQPVERTIAHEKNTGTAASKRTAIELAFDHKWLIDVAHERLASRLREPSGTTRFEFVPSQFTLSQLQRVHELIGGVPIQSRSFRAELLATGAIEPVAAGRGSRNRLYRWKQ